MKPSVQTTPTSVVKPPKKTRREAVAAGINYFGTSGELRGCINDCEDFARKVWYPAGYHVTMLNDASTTPRDYLPTKRNMFREYSRLVKGAMPGDKIGTQFSGHGYFKTDHGEVDLKSEVLCPIAEPPADLVWGAGELRPDYTTGSGVDYITDDELHKIWSVTPAGVQVFALIDACHSGSGSDLPWRWDGKRWHHEHVEYTGGDESKIGGIWKADFIQLSGCADSQTSADAWIRGRYNGAMTAAAIVANNAMKSRKKSGAVTTWRQWHADVQKNTRGFTQIPQINFSDKKLLDKPVEL